MQKLNSERGMSLVEATIILLVLFLLTAVISPTLAVYVNDARNVKAQEDVVAIGTALEMFLKDVAKPFPQETVSATDFTVSNRVNMLVTAGNTPGATEADFASAGNLGGADINWDDAIAADPSVELLEDHLVDNTAGYTDVAFAAANVTGGPRVGIGWRGPYLSQVGADPWGYRYAVNTAFLAAGSDATAKGWLEDVFVISAGSNGSVETAFGSQEFEGAGDDIAYLIQGATR